MPTPCPSGCRAWGTAHTSRVGKGGMIIHKTKLLALPVFPLCLMLAPGTQLVMQLSV